MEQTKQFPYTTGILHNIRYSFASANYIGTDVMYKGIAVGSEPLTYSMRPVLMEQAK